MSRALRSVAGVGVSAAAVLGLTACNSTATPAANRATTPAAPRITRTCTVWIAYAAACAVAAGGLAAVLLYRYVDVPALGPIPPMYAPLWFAKETVTAVAGAAAAGALIGFLSRSQSAAPR
jgi:hypothetical protein